MRRKLEFAVLVIGLLYATSALAQSLPILSAGNPNATKVLGWFTLVYLANSCLIRALAPDNTTLPFAPSTATLHWINVGSAAVQTICLATFGGQPWLQALAAGVLQAFLGLTHVGDADGQRKQSDKMKTVFALQPTKSG